MFTKEEEDKISAIASRDNVPNIEIRRLLGAKPEEMQKEILDKWYGEKLSWAKSIRLKKRTRKPFWKL